MSHTQDAIRCLLIAILRDMGWGTYMDTREISPNKYITCKRINSISMEYKRRIHIWKTRRDTKYWASRIDKNIDRNTRKS